MRENYCQTFVILLPQAFKPWQAALRVLGNQGEKRIKCFFIEASAFHVLFITLVCKTVDLSRFVQQNI